MSNELLNALSGSNKNLFDAHPIVVEEKLGRLRPATTIQPQPIGSFFTMPQQNQQNQHINFTPATITPEIALKPPSILPMILGTGLAMFFIYCNKKN
jgi:hypothetical protein